MNFGEKIRAMRTQKGWSAEDLAKQIGVNVRTIYAYESGSRYPRHHDIYGKLADAFGVDVNYLRTENEEFMTEVGEQYGTRGQSQYVKAITEVQKLFAGGELPEEDKLSFLLEVQQLFIDSKQQAKKFTPKKYLDQKANPDQ